MSTFGGRIGDANSQSSEFCSIMQVRYLLYMSLARMLHNHPTDHECCILSKWNMYCCRQIGSTFISSFSTHHVYYEMFFCASKILCMLSSPDHLLSMCIIYTTVAHWSRLVMTGQAVHDLQLHISLHNTYPAHFSKKATASGLPYIPHSLQPQSCGAGNI